MNKAKPCSPEEFDNFLSNYPRELERSVSLIYDPALITYNDFTLGKYPDSVVAWCYGDWWGSPCPYQNRIIKREGFSDRIECNHHILNTNTLGGGE